MWRSSNMTQDVSVSTRKKANWKGSFLLELIILTILNIFQTFITLITWMDGSDENWRGNCIILFFSWRLVLCQIIHFLRIAIQIELVLGDLRLVDLWRFLSEVLVRVVLNASSLCWCHSGPYITSFVYLLVPPSYKLKVEQKNLFPVGWVFTHT